MEPVVTELEGTGIEPDSGPPPSLPPRTKRQSLSGPTGPSAKEVVPDPRLRSSNEQPKGGPELIEMEKNGVQTPLNETEKSGGGPPLIEREKNVGQGLPRREPSFGKRSGKRISLYKKVSDASKHKSRVSGKERERIPGFERLSGLDSVNMALDWVKFRIWEEGGEDLFHVAQTRLCSLSVTDSNELFIRKPNAENVLRIHSNIAEGLRHFSLYTASEKYVGSITCDARQAFKVPANLKSIISGQTYAITCHREGNVKSWTIAESGTGCRVARVDVRTGHRWKSLYTVTFLEKSSACTRILVLGVLLAIASARLESETLPALFAISAFFLTFVIFFIIQFT